MRFKIFFFQTILCGFFAVQAMGQQPANNDADDPITAGWKKVDAFMKKNLPQSALAEVKNIYTLAKKQDKDAQVIKSLLYMISLQRETRENNEIASIKDIESEITGSKQPVGFILKSLLAGMYWNYYQAHRWQFYNRTQTSEFKKDDIATWTAEDFYKKIGELFLQSLKDEKLLQQTKLDPFDPVIAKGNTRNLRPTLFDLLAFRALAYFENNERDLKKPAYAFEINQAGAFDPAADFITQKFPTKDSLSLQQKALLIYQELIAFHLHDTKPDALIDADLQRLEFVRSNSVHPDKDNLYLQAISHITHQYGNLPVAAQAWYLLAAYYNEKADSYEPYGDTTYHLDRLKAKDICEKVIDQKDSSEGSINCFNLLNRIKEPSLYFSLEKVNIPGQPFRVLVNYRNFSSLYLRLIRANDNLKKEMDNSYNDENWAAILATAPLKNWEQALPVTNDFQKHSAEIKAEALPAGEYLLLASTAKDFGNKQAMLGARFFYVSSISYVNNLDDFFVLDRDNGQPLANANVQVWGQKYDYKVSRYIKEKGELYTTNANGFFSIAGKKEENNRNTISWMLDITHNGEELFMDDLIYDYYSYRNTTVPKTLTSIFLFTDRGIYRPGQTVYFKGIVLEKNADEKSGAVRAGYETSVFLRDANNKDVDTIKVKTNEFGSFSGKFQLPESGLNGEFAIHTKKEPSFASFRVEEYKRPKFYVDYEPIKGTYKVNDKIKVTGVAKAYAGNNIDGATVKYRVVRQPRFLYYWMFRGWQPPTNEMEITHGEISTDKDGKFIVEFTAIPDLKTDKKFDPVFDYTVFADVTDVNGETRSGSKMITAGYKSLVLRVNEPDRMPADSLKSFSISTENMNGQFEPAKVNVSMTRLKEEKRLIRTRFWERPDQFVMTKDEYIRNFPYDEYDNESNYDTWEKGAVVLEKTDSSRVNGQLSIVNNELGTDNRQPATVLKPGFYKIEFSTKDKNGEVIKDIKYIELYDENSNRLDYAQYLWTEPALSIEPGEKTSVKLGTSADNLFVVQQVDKGSRQAITGNYSFLNLNNEKKSFEFSATEADRGGYEVAWLFVKHNRFYNYQQGIDVPWTNKDLKIEYASFRDKTLPGSEEKWKLKISGYKNDGVAAEILASMYDASLDQFLPYSWNQPFVWPNYYSRSNWNGRQNFMDEVSVERYKGGPESRSFRKEYDKLFNGMFDMSYYSDQSVVVMGYGAIKQRFDADESVKYDKIEMPVSALQGKVPGVVVANGENKEGLNEQTMIRLRGDRDLSADKQPLLVVDGVITPYSKLNDIDPADILKIDILKGEDAIALYGDKGKNGVVVISTKNGNKSSQQEVQVRKNFNETAFFLPDLHTDSTGAIEFSFTLPEALTRWKFQALAHTKGLAFGYSSKEIVTQKQLMVQPNVPRFLREGDHMEFSAKIVNLTEKELTGQAELQLFDATTNERVDGWFQNSFANQYFTVAAGQSEAVKFPIEVPYLFNKALTWRVVAKAGDFSDGEEAALPVLTNRMLVTETMPLPMRGTGSKNFSFDKLLKSGNSETLQQYALTVEYTSNPAWYAVEALPYLMEYPYECAEQTWNRYYANMLASRIANSSPRIQQVFDQWKIKDTTALMSNLQKNEDLKSVLLEETPWVLEAKNETEQKKNIALLFDLLRMSKELNKAYDKMKQLQSSNGGFVWFAGGPDDRYMTQYIVTGIGHLKKVAPGANGKGYANGQNENLQKILYTAIPYLDRKLKEDYDNLVKYKADLSAPHLGYVQIQYLYMRSFFPEYAEDKASETAYNYYYKQAQQYWTSQSKYMQGMIALALSRTGDAKTPADILRSLKETSINNEELGMYWKEMTGGWFWYEAPIETQALLIEAFQEAGKDTKTADDLRTWLLKNKQTNNWKTTKATAEACYALLLQGTEWLTSEPAIEIKLGNTVVRSDENKQEAGTGYFRKTFESDKVKPEMGNITVTVDPAKASTPGASWGGVYWQYFEDLDKITTATTPLKLAKKLFIETNSDRGPVLTPVNNEDILKVGDKIKVRIELRVDRDMEYVQMKDMRASCLEPVNVLSGYKWQDGLGYYESTKDASTNFFFNNLRKGTYVFEYSLFVTHAGNFSNGITSIQCMYAPEFTSHSEGVRITVE